jgi:hypothetical protein
MAPTTLDERIENLLEFEAEHGHLIVPYGYKANGLGHWVNNTRAQRKRGGLKPDAIAKLDDVGFVWVAPTGPAREELIAWGRQFRWLANFRKARGHCRVPSKIAGEAVPVAAWCDRQRQLHLAGKLDQDKFQKLSKLGFDFYGSSEDNEAEPVSRKSTDFSLSFTISHPCSPSCPLSTVSPLWVCRFQSISAPMMIIVRRWKPFVKRTKVSGKRTKR